MSSAGEQGWKGSNTPQDGNSTAESEEKTCVQGVSVERIWGERKVWERCQSRVEKAETMTKMLSAGLCCTSPVMSVIFAHNVCYCVIDGTDMVMLIFLRSLQLV